MIPNVTTQTGAGTSAPIVLNLHTTPFAVGIGCVLSGGAANYTVQHTFDDVMNLGAGACTWFNHDDPVLVGATANANSNFDYPVRAARLVVNSGAGTVTATFIQAGIIG